ncbi:MAG: hypothetical protein QOD80_1373, partial [Verrucomicrobiota bacterium]
MLLLALVALFACQAVFAGPPVISATKDVVGGNTRKNPGDTVTYKITIGNSNAVGTADATGLQLVDSAPNQTADVPSTLNVTPVAIDDAYVPHVIANTSINTANSTNFSVVSNDYPGFSGGNAVALASLTITAFDSITAGGGTVSMTTSGANVGKFTYTPAPGFTGTDTFTYTISNGVSGTPAGSNTGTVSIIVDPPVVWYVDPSVASTGTGRLGSPFKTLAEAITAIGANTGQRIFLYSTATAQTGNFVLKASGWLVGQAAVGTDFDTLMGIIYPADTTLARPSINNATKPVITNSAGDTITLGEGNKIVGVAVTNTGGAGKFAITGVSINGVTIGNATTSDVTLGSSGTSGGAVSLTGAASGTAAINAPITSSGGHSVNITGRTGGTVTFSNTITETSGGTGINLATNTGATLTFSGVLSLTTTSNAAFAATGGGTVNVTAATNAITTTTGTALNIANTTIGPSGVTFNSISANGAVNAIILNTTGTNPFSVTGDGTQTSGLYNRNGTGGTLQNTTHDAVLLTSASNVTLRQMNITNAGWDGVQSTGGGNIILSAMDINHPGNANPDSAGGTGNPSGFGGGNGWYAENITGTNRFDNNSRIFNWQASQSNGVLIHSTGTNFTSFTMDHVLISTSATAAAGIHG